MLFISDLHLSPARSRVTSLFLAFLEQRACQADTLYILGDLFDFWVGDDDPTPPRKTVIRSLRQLAKTGTAINIVQGNRDFLLAEQFAGECGASLLEDCIVIECNNLPTLLMHGDLLCTDDHAYQEFRRLSRSRDWQEKVLGKPLWLRLVLARWYRLRSYLHKRDQMSDIMDVNAETVWQYAERYQVLQLIHGHTHRPGCYLMNKDRQSLHRYVLGEWGPSAEIVSLDTDGLKIEQISMNERGQLNCRVLKTE